MVRLRKGFKTNWLFDSGLVNEMPIIQLFVKIIL